MYTVKYEYKSITETTWRCVRRVADSCHAILKTTNDEVSTLAKSHNYPSDKTAVEIEKCRQIMKQQANSTNDRPNQILTFSTATALDELQTRLKNLCQDRLQGRKSIAEFLRGVSLNIRGGQLHI